MLLGALLGVSQSWTFCTGTAYDPQRTGPIAILSNQSTRGFLLRLRDGSFSWLDGNTLITTQLLVSAAAAGLGLRLLPVVFGLLNVPRSRLPTAVAGAVIVVPMARVIWWVPHQFDRVHDYHGLEHVANLRSPVNAASAVDLPHGGHARIHSEL